MQFLLIDLHLIRLDLSSAATAACRHLLSADERLRADRFATPRLRNRWLVSRAGLRDIIARYCRKRPSAVRFHRDRSGKPVLSGEKSAAALHFNLSHSGSIAAVAVTTAGPVGVDVEYLRPISDWRRVARRFFSVSENSQLSTVQEVQRELAFYCCWTRKEAVIKATGEGLTAELDSFDVSLKPGKPAAVLCDRSEHQRSGPWQLRHFDGENFVGAVAIQSPCSMNVANHGFWSMQSE
jgi:4'-phosphopantetheinyl transferase